MTDTRRARLRDAMDSALSNLMAVLPGADNEPGWELPVGEESWNVRQVLAHLATAEAGMTGLIAAALRAQAEGAPVGPQLAVGRDGQPFDRDRWNVRQVEKRLSQPASALRVELTEVRTITLRTLAAHTDAELDAPAWHPAIGECTVEAIYKVIAIHMKDHTRAMKVVLRDSYGHYWAEAEQRGRG